MTDAPDRLAEFGQLLKNLPAEAGAGVELLILKSGPLRGAILRRLAIPHQTDNQVLRILEPSLSEEDAASLMQKLARLSFLLLVDNRLVMHDDVRRYLLDWWQQDDHRRGFSEISARLADYFNRQVDVLGGAERADAQRKSIYHQIATDPESGFARFEVAFRAARYKHAIGECATLVTMVRELDGILSPVQRLWLTYHESKLLADTYSFQAAREKLMTVLETADVPIELCVRALFRLGSLSGEQQLWHKAIGYYQDALKLFRAEAAKEESELWHRILDGLGNALRETNQLEEAEQMLQRSLYVADRCGDQSLLARCHNSFGTLHRKRGDAKLAIEAFTRSLDCLEQNSESFRQAQVYNNLGLAWADLGEGEKSREFLEKSLEIEQRAGDKRRQAKTMANLVRVHTTLGDSSKGFEVADEAVGLLLQIHDWHEAAVIKRSKARILRREERLDEARKEFTEAAALFGKVEAHAEQEQVEHELKRLGIKKRLPWYVWLAILFWVIFVGLLVLISVNSEL